MNPIPYLWFRGLVQRPNEPVSERLQLVEPDPGHHVLANHQRGDEVTAVLHGLRANGKNKWNCLTSL